MAKPDESDEPDEGSEPDEGESDGPRVEDVFRDGLMAGAQMIQMLLRELLRLGGNPSDLNLVSADAALRDQIAQLIMKRAAELQSFQEFEVEVDYSLSLHRLIAIGGFDEVDKAVHKAKFDDLITGPPKKLVARLIRPDHAVPPKLLIEHAKKMGFRVADAKALVVFVTKEPEAQFHHPVYGLGSIGHDPENGEPVALCATTDLDKKKRILMAEEVNVDMDPVNFVLIVKDADGSKPQEA